jgi:hypothetical protein
MIKKLKLESLELGVNDYRLIDQHLERIREIAWRQSFIDEIFALVHFAEKPLTMTKHFKELKEICLRYGIEGNK